MDTYLLKLVAYVVKTGLIAREDIVYCINRLLELFGLEETSIGDTDVINMVDSGTPPDADSNTEQALGKE